MILIKHIEDLQNLLKVYKEKLFSIGFVPTMGALHAGHISLIEASRSEHPITVCSIFINPTQFNNPIDFQTYPVTIEKDIRLLEAAGCNVLFAPREKELYPEPQTYKVHPATDLGDILRGLFGNDELLGGGGDDRLLGGVGHCGSPLPRA